VKRKMALAVSQIVRKLKLPLSPSVPRGGYEVRRMLGDLEFGRRCIGDDSYYYWQIYKGAELVAFFSLRTTTCGGLKAVLTTRGRVLHLLVPYSGPIPRAVVAIAERINAERIAASL
jgi:hypothetical protein